MSQEIQFESLNNLNIGAHMMIKSFPCKIISKTTSKTGKHGSAKSHVTGKDIFTDKKYEEIFSSSEKVEIPVIVRVNYTVQFVEVNKDNNSLFQVYVVEDQKEKDFPIEVDATNETNMEMINKINESLEHEGIDCVVCVIQSGGKERITQVTSSKN